MIFFFNRKTAYGVRISDWSSDVCASDLPEPWDEEVRVADAVAKLTEVKSRGISTIVDPTVIGLGRYIPRIVRINEQVDLNIIVATAIGREPRRENAHQSV